MLGVGYIIIYQISISQKTMDNTQQLPAEYATKLHMVEQENKELKGDIQLMKDDIRSYEREKKELQQEVDQLKQWKSEASELVSPILRYGQSKEAAIPLGQSITEVVLERCKRLHHEEKKNDLLEEALEHWNNKATGAIDLLKKFISRHEAGLLPDRFIYDEIKQFLDGK
jgi:DNA repair exonuclease SbcCD ATPase subunit